ncbi:tetratricopeptide repeat protein [Planctomycetota bacterium]
MISRTGKLVFLVLLACVNLSIGKPLANENKSGLYARSIEYILKLDDDEIDLAKAVLIISQQWNDDVDIGKYTDRLDDMAFEIQERLRKRKLKANYKAIPVINEYLFKELGFKAVKEAIDPQDLFLHSVLDRKQGYCLSLSVLYLSIGERLGMKLYGVVVPGHFFVRYDDGRTRFNIETTGNGGTGTDEHYIEKFEVPQGDDYSVYMENLDKRQTLACFFNNLGNTYSDCGELDSALTALERAVEINPSLAESRVNLGNIYLQKEWVKDAIDQYRIALRIKPNDPKAHNNLGNAYLQYEWLNEAIDEYKKSIKLDPKFVDAYKNLAIAYSKNRMYSDARRILERVLPLDSKDSDCYKQLGDIDRELGNYDQAISNYKKSLRLDRNLAESHFGIAMCYYGTERIDKAIQEYKKALDIEPDMTAAMMNLGNIYFSRKKYDDAIEYYKKANRVRPEDNTVRYNLGAAYCNNGNYEKAVIEHLKVIEADPEMGAAHYSLSLAFYHLKKYERAAEHIQTAKELGEVIDEDLYKAIKKKVR